MQTRLSGAFFFLMMNFQNLFSIYMGLLVALLELSCSTGLTLNDLGIQRNNVKDPTLALSGTMVSIGAGTYPRASKLNDPSMPAGSIIGVYTAFEDGENVITIVTSKDNGASWQHRGEVSRAPSATRFLDHGNILQLRNGRLLCVFANHDKVASGVYTFYRLTICYSDDNGATWSYLSNPQSHAATPANNGMWEPLLRNTLDNRAIQLYWSQEYSATNQDIVMTPSSDQGETWGALITVAGAGIESRDGMTGVTAIVDSQLIAVFESQQQGQFTIKRVLSPNDGQTWDERAQVYQPGGGPCSSAAAPQIVNVGGRLCVSFMTDEDNAPVATQASSFDTNTAVKVLVSADGGQSWGGKVEVGPAQSLWASVLALDDSSFLALFDHAGSVVQKVIVS